MIDFLTAITPLIIIHTIAMIALIASSYTDLKRREVPDWISIGLVCLGIFVNLLFSILFWDYNYILGSLVGFAAVLLLGWIMFYSGQWGGGDSKMLMALGALLGINPFVHEIPWFAHFIFNLIIVGAVYGLLWTVYLIISKFNAFSRSLQDLLKERRLRQAKATMFFVLLLLILMGVLIMIVPQLRQFSFMSGFILYIALVVPLTFYLWIAVKAVEKSCMLKFVLPGQLTEGDWIAKDIVVKGKTIASPKDLGIDKKQIAILKKLYTRGLIKKILIKEGIPFLPSFLIAYALTVAMGNILFYFI